MYNHQYNKNTQNLNQNIQLVGIENQTLTHHHYLQDPNKLTRKLIYMLAVSPSKRVKLSSLFEQCIVQDNLEHWIRWTKSRNANQTHDDLSREFYFEIYSLLACVVQIIAFQIT